MAASTHTIKMLNSDAKAEEVGQKTIDYLTKVKLINQYEVKELKPAAKPADLEKSKPAAAKAE